MSNWKTIFESQECVTKIQEALRAWDGVDIQTLSPIDLANYERLLRVLRVLESRFARLDPELYHQGIWANIGNWLSNARNYGGNFAGDKNPSHIQNANASIDEVLQLVRPADAPSDEQDIASLSAAAGVFRGKLIQELEATRVRFAQVKTEFDSISNEIAQARSRLQSNDQTIEQQKGRVDQSIGDFQGQFSQAEASRASEFAAASQRFLSDFAGQLKTLQSEADNAAAARSNEWAAFKEKNEKASNAFMEFFGKRQSEVDAIFGAIGSASLSGHFARTADNDGKAANRLRWIALVLMGAMIAVGGISFYQSFEHPGVDWKIFLFRLATVFVIAIPAVYAAQESSKHRRREQRNRKMELELASIDAYLVQLPAAKRDEVKEKLTEKFFGQPEVPENDEPVTRHQLFDLLSAVLKNVTKGK